MSDRSENAPAQSAPALWQRYRKYLCADRDLGLSLDVSRMRFAEADLDAMKPAIARAFEAMKELEAGAIANPDEKRQVGHYWLRAPDLAPDAAIGAKIRDALAAIKDFCARVHGGEIMGPSGKAFANLVLVGIGGSVLGPQFVSYALGTSEDRLRVHFCDNTDPDGIDRIVAEIGDGLGQTLVLVASKSGSTPETRNGAAEIREAFRRQGLEFAKAAVAVTGENSVLDRQASEEGWLASFPVWEWVGGRNSVLSPSGLLPCALQGIDIDALLEGACRMDEWTRDENPLSNPAAVLALMWHYAGKGQGEKNMVILPYKDRLILFSRSLQQLVMESLGKEHDLEGNVVHQGLAVYGNKGSTDQHAYVQQLRDGTNDFFVTFIEVLRDRVGAGVEVEPATTAGDYLNGFLQGTRSALYERGRESVTITIPEVSAFTVGMLIALFERAVGLYAGMIGINAYNQPGVEAGKQAASKILELQAQVLEWIQANSEEQCSAEAIAEAIGRPDEPESVYKILEHLAANSERGVRRIREAEPTVDLFTLAT